jgi:hypothetical protein
MTRRPDSVAAAEARVRQLAESFGGDPARWPEADRPGAEAWIAAHPAEARRLLEDARSLDRLLFAWEAPRPTAAVTTRVQAAAPVQVRQSLRRSWVLTLTGGAALAAACLAGIVAAPRLVDPVLRPAAAPVYASDPDSILSEALTPWEAPVAESAMGVRS